MPFEHLQKARKNVAFQLHFVCTLFVQFVENHYLYIVIERLFCVGLSRSQTFHATSLSSRLMIFAFILRLSLSHSVCSIPLSYSG